MSEAEARFAEMRAEGLEPSRAVKPNGFSYLLRLSPPRPDKWSARKSLGPGLSLHPSYQVSCQAVGAARLVSTPSRPESFRLGLARDCHFTGFPEFEQFCIAGFPDEHSSHS